MKENALLRGKAQKANELKSILAEVAPEVLEAIDDDEPADDDRLAEEAN